MCGIIGISHCPRVAEDLFLGLQNLQHRGQDGGGIVTWEGTQLHQHRGGGLLEIAFPPENFERLLGNVGIGHTRYTTTGRKTTGLLQPFVDNPLGLTIAHNGNIVNYHSLKADLLSTQPDALQTSCDSELILWVLSQGIQQHGQTPAGLLQSVCDLSQQLVGSYSVIGFLAGVGLFAFRDPHGLRPLVMGQRHDQAEPMTAFASESTALAFLGYPQWEDVQPGELIIASPEGQIIRQTYTIPTPRHCMFEWVYFARVESTIETLPVYQARFQLGLELAHEIRRLGLQPDIIVPIPETSRIAATAISERLGIPCREVLIKNRYVNRTFILESQAARQEAIRRKLYPVASEIVGRKVLMVDDSIVRGNTAIQIVDLLRRSGAKEIYLASTCPPIRFPCYYGIDFPDQNELLAGSMPLEALQQHLGVDALIYQPIEGLKNALLGEKLCTACLDGNYPTDISCGEEFTQQRTLEREVIIK